MQPINRPPQYQPPQGIDIQKQQDDFKVRWQTISQSERLRHCLFNEVQTAFNQVYSVPEEDRAYLLERLIQNAQEQCKNLGINEFEQMAFIGFLPNSLKAKCRLREQPNENQLVIMGNPNLGTALYVERDGHNAILSAQTSGNQTYKLMDLGNIFPEPAHLPILQSLYLPPPQFHAPHAPLMQSQQAQPYPPHQPQPQYLNVQPGFQQQYPPQVQPPFPPYPTPQN
jgi:hypothetical protein